MAQRGLDDWEIALIKRMMIEGYARDRMHAYFNRPERTLTPAAYSEIKLGKFGTNVEPANPDMLARFVDRFANSRHAAEGDPLGPLALARLLSLEKCGTKLTQRENGQIEFKLSFSFQENTFSKIVRAMCALANNAGGYIFCGIEDATGHVKGLWAHDLFIADLARWSRIIRDCLMPVPTFERIIFDVAGQKIGIIYVEECANKPIVATKKFGDKIRSGGIYYRYPGESAEIQYGEMALILAQRDRNAQRQIVDTLGIFAERSPDDLAIIDLKNAGIANAKTPVKLSQAFIDQLNVIKEGEFSEKNGAPAVRIVANATVAPAGQETKIVRGFASDAAVVKNFVKQSPVAEPLQYFLAAINSSSDWLPIFRWLGDSCTSIPAAVELVKSENLTPKKRIRALERIKGTRSAKQTLQPSLKALKFELLECKVPEIKNATDLRRLMQAIRGIDSASEMQMKSLWEALDSGFEFAWSPAKSGDLQSYVKAAAARIDELAWQRSRQDELQADVAA